MTSSLGSPFRPGARRLCAGLLLSACVIWPAGARAQVESPVVGQPLKLAPLITPEPESGAGQSVPGAAGAAGAAAVQPETGLGTALPEPTPQIEGIEINRLNEMDPEAVGILDPAAGGLGGDLWRGSERSTIERLLPRLPGSMNSITMRELARRLLLSNAAPPASQAGGLDSRTTNLLALRVSRLAAMGDFDGLTGLLDVAPQRYDSEAVARARVETLFLDGRGGSACQEVRHRVTEFEGSTYWRKSLVFCQILLEDLDAAQLGLGLLREEGATEQDPAFFQLADNLLGLRTDGPPAAPASALHLAMLQASGGPLPPELANGASPGLAVLMARAKGNSLPQRAAAAERSVVNGLMEPEELAELYLEFSFEADQRANAISSAEQLEGPERRALLYQAALAQDVPAARAELLNVALADAHQQGTYTLMARVLLSMIGEIPLQPELAWFAESAGRALYAAGQFEQASGWLTLARQESLLNSQAAVAVAALWPYSRLAGTTAFSWKGDLATWAEARPGATPEETASRQLLLRVIFQALGHSDSMTWADLVGVAPPEGDAGPQPDTALIYALSEASQLGRRGETVLLSLLALGDGGPGATHPLVLHEVLRALTRVDLGYEARLLAIEAAVANGI